MRQVNLNGKYYKIKGDIVKRAVNPWKAQVRSAGTREFSDFSQAEMEEYHDFRNGIGRESALPEESGRLWWTEGIDFSTPRSAVLGPLVNSTSITALSAPSITNEDMEDAASGWTNGTRNIAYNHTSGGSYSYANDGATVVYQDLSGFVPGAEYTFTCWVLTIGAGRTPTVRINDGIDDTDGTEHSGTVEQWEQLTVTKTLSPVATRLRVSMVPHNATANNDFMDDAAISVTAFTAGAPAKILDFGDKTYAATSTGLLKWNTTSSEWDVKVVYPDLIDAIVATDATDSYLVVSTAALAIYSTDGDSWSTLTGCKGYLAWYDTKLRSIDTDGNTLRSSAANDVDGTWTNFTLSGDFGTVYDLFEGKLLEDGSPTLYFSGTEGLYSVDVTNQVAYKQEVEYPGLAYSGHVGKYWNANVWVSTGYGILKVSPSMATYVGPDQDDGLPSTYQGYIYDMDTVNNWLVYCVNGGSTDKSSILKRNASLGGNLQVYTTSAINKPIACLYHSPSSLYANGRLWFGEDTTIKYMMFPDITSNVKQVSTYQYVDDSGYGELPIFRKLAAISKTALGVAAITKSCDSDDYIEVFYGLNGADPTTSLGTLKSSPRPTILTWNSGLGTAFYTIQLAVKFYRNGGNTTSPELESLMFYYLPTPTRISTWTFNVDTTGEDDANAVFEEFEAIYDTTTLVAFYPSGDTAKDSFNVKLTQMPSREWWEESGKREAVFQVVVEEIFKG